MPGRNGKHAPPHPRLEIRAPTATPEEAAAIAVALEQFLVENAPRPRPAEATSRWQRAALAEGIGARQIEPGRGWGPALGG